MSCLPQAAEAVKFIGIGPADDPATVAGHLTKHAHPTALIQVNRVFFDISNSPARSMTSHSFSLRAFL